MPLLCISLLALLLLPLSLSCDSARPLREVQSNYMPIVRTHLVNTRRIINDSLDNLPCPELRHKLHNCTPNSTSIVSTLHLLTCKMRNLRLSHTQQLTSSVLNSIQCPCPEKVNKEPNTRPRAVTRRRRNERNKSKETKKLCKASVILSAITECYEMLTPLLITQEEAPTSFKLPP